MKTFIQMIAIIVAVFGVFMIAGSAGDCDGKCMENANTMPEMMQAIAIGLAMVVGGALVALKVK